MMKLITYTKNGNNYVKNNKKIMKTKDFIKMLQEEDPNGESYLRINGDPVWFLEGKPGYWDGPYSYIERGEDDKYTWTQSTEGFKVDIHTMDMYSFAESFRGDWEEMKKHIKVTYTYLDDEREKEFMKYAEKQCESYNEIMDIVKNDKPWTTKIDQEKWDQLTEYEQHLWLMDNDSEYERVWYKAIKRNINN